jgi:hypothetical protein
MVLGQRFAAALLAAGAAVATARAEEWCGPPAVSVHSGVDRSRWDEYNAAGQRLVRETGALHRHRLAAHRVCAHADWTLAWSFSQGERGYDGQTNKGARVLSSSDLRTHELQLSAWLPMQGAWSLGAQAGWSQTRRELRSTTTALGFPEQFRHWGAELGLRVQQPLGDSLVASASAWVGGGPGGAVRVGLPGYAPVNLPLGSHRTAAVGLALSAPSGSDAQGWRWSGALVVQRQAFRAGEARVLSKAGQAVGTAWQPQSLHQQVRWTVGASHAF